MGRLYTVTAYDNNAQRALTRAWQRVRSGRAS
jgi:hypothetical protein